MKKIVIFFIVILVFACGCIQMPESDETRDLSPQPTQEITQPPAEASPAQTPQQNLNPFPDALSLKEKFAYGDEKDGRIMAVDDAYIEDSYWYHSVAHGYDWEFLPDEGNKLVFIELWAKHNGTSRELGVPLPGNVNIWYNDKFYSSLEERDGAIAQITKPYNTPDDYYGGSIGRYGKQEGVLIYEVPKSLTLDKAYIQVNLGNMYAAPAWKLG